MALLLLPQLLVAQVLFLTVAQVHPSKEAYLFVACSGRWLLFSLGDDINEAADQCLWHVGFYVQI